jgi:hypothetical protein
MVSSLQLKSRSARLQLFICLYDLGCRLGVYPRLNYVYCEIIIYKYIDLECRLGVYLYLRNEKFTRLCLPMWLRFTNYMSGSFTCYWSKISYFQVLGVLLHLMCSSKKHSEIIKNSELHFNISMAFSEQCVKFTCTFKFLEYTVHSIHFMSALNSHTSFSIIL